MFIIHHACPELTVVKIRVGPAFGKLCFMITLFDDITIVH